MTARRFVLQLAVAALVVSSTTSCSGAKNDSHAYFSPQRSGYLVELKGTRHRLAHDPISAIFGNTYEETHELELPRIEGTIEGREIPRFKYSGQIVISGNTMTVALTEGDSGKKSSWNGTYVLGPKVDPSPREIAAVKTTMLRGDKSEAVLAAEKLMNMGRAGRRTVYDELVNNPDIRNKIADALSSMYISRPERIERWVPEDLADLETLARNGDDHVMRVGMSFLSCTEEGRKALREIGRTDPSKQATAVWYLDRQR